MRERERKKGLVLDALREGAKMGDAIRACGLRRQATLNDWMNADADFARAVYDARGIPDDAVENSLYLAATVPDEKGHVNVTACIFWLKNRRPERWRDVHRQEFVGQVNVEAEIQIEGEVDADRVGTILEVLDQMGALTLPKAARGSRARDPSALH